jgi:hypothetical protein
MDIWAGCTVWICLSTYSSNTNMKSERQAPFQKRLSCLEKDSTYMPHTCVSLSWTYVNTEDAETWITSVSKPRYSKNKRVLPSTSRREHEYSYDPILFMRNESVKERNWQKTKCDVSWKFRDRGYVQPNQHGNSEHRSLRIPWHRSLPQKVNCRPPHHISTTILSKS